MSSKADPRTTNARRRRAAELREKQARGERRRRRTFVTGVVVVVLAAVVGIGVAVQSGRDSGGGGSAAPAGTTADGTGFALGQSDAPVTVEVYEDFQCPACRAFEEASGRTLSDLVDAGTVRVVYRPIAFLDRASTDRYSTRALNAAACVADDAGTSGFVTYHESLFAEQPAEGGPGIPDEQLTAQGVKAGADGGQIGGCIRDLAFGGWAADVTDAASRAGVNGTPTVLVAGERVEVPSLENLRAAVQRAAG